MRVVGFKENLESTIRVMSSRHKKSRNYHMHSRIELNYAHCTDVKQPLNNSISMPIHLSVTLVS